MIEYLPAKTKRDLEGILKLQQENLTKNMSKEEAHQQGFVTVEHQLEVLQSMNNAEPSMTIQEDGQVVGYCLAMLRQFQWDVPILGAFFARLDQLTYQGQLLSELTYMVVGQVCIGKDYRGKGHFDGMYQAYRQFFQTRYAFAVTEVAAVNQRSLMAHYRVGFKDLDVHRHQDGRWWHVVIWDWQSK